MKVFIAEDSPAVLDRILRIARKIPNFELAGTADTAAQTIEGITQSRPDAVTLDITLRSGTGFDVLRAIQQIEPRPVMIILTASDTPWRRERCRREGADYFLCKSSEFSRIPEILSGLTTSAEDAEPPSQA